MSESHYGAVIFDFNGVLFWDATQQLQSWQGLARVLRGYPMSDEEALAHMQGRPNGYVLSYLAGRQIVGEELPYLSAIGNGEYQVRDCIHPSF